MRLEDIGNSISEWGVSLFYKVLHYLPTVVFVLVLFVVGKITANVARKSLARVFGKLKLNAWLDKIGFQEMLGQFKLDLDVEKGLSKLVYTLIMFMTVYLMLSILNIEAITVLLRAFMAWLPDLFAALLIIAVGSYIAGKLKKVVENAAGSIGVSGARVLGNIVFYVLFVFMLITALNKAGIDTDLISTNIVILIGAVLLAFSIAYGIAAREILRNILSSYYSKGRFREGQEVKVGQYTGRIVELGSLSVTIETKDKKVVLPANKFISEEVEILSEADIQDENVSS